MLTIIRTVECKQLEIKFLHLSLYLMKEKSSSLINQIDLRVGMRLVKNNKRRKERVL